MVESYVAPEDFEMNGETLKKGSWVLVTKASEVWEQIKKDEITGYSMAGTAETSELKFWGKSLSGTKRALRGQKVDDGTFATSTKGKSEAWSFDITGFKEIVMELTALTNGNFSVRGTAVS